jgi:hypothetical protein
MNSSQLSTHWVVYMGQNAAGLVALRMRLRPDGIQRSRMASRGIGIAERGQKRRRGLVPPAVLIDSILKPLGLRGASPSRDAQAGQGTLAQEHHTLRIALGKPGVGDPRVRRPYFDFFGTRFFG